MNFQEKLNLAKNNFSQRELNGPNKMISSNTIEKGVEKKTNSSESTTKSECTEKETKSVVVQSANLVKVISQPPSNNTSEKPVQNDAKTVSNIQNNPILARVNEIKQKEAFSSLSNKTNQNSQTSQINQSTVKNNTTKDNEDVDKKSDIKGNNVVTNNVKEEIKSNVDNKTVITQSSNFKNNPFLNQQLKTPSNSTSHTLNKFSNNKPDTSKSNQPVLDKTKDNTSLPDTKKDIPNTLKVISTNTTKSDNTVSSEKSDDNIKNTNLPSTQKTPKQVSFVNGFENQSKKEEPKTDFKSKLQGMAQTFSMKNMMRGGLSKIPEEPSTTTISNAQEENVSKIEVNEKKNESDNIEDILMRRTTRNLRVHKKTIVKF